MSAATLTCAFSLASAAWRLFGKTLDEGFEVFRILAVLDEGPQHLVDGDRALDHLGSSGGPSPGRARSEHETRLDRAGDPGDLPVSGRLADVAAHGSERVVDVEARLLQRVGERRGVWAVDAGAVIGDLAGAGGEGQQHLAAAGLGVGETLLQALLGGHRVVAAGVEDEQFYADRVILDDVDEVVERDGVGDDLLGRLGPRVDRQQQVLAVVLNGVPGIVEQGHVGAGQMRADGVLKVFDRGLLDVVEKQHVEVEVGERVGDQLGVVARVGQRRERILAVADDDRRAFLGVSGAGDEKAEGCKQSRQEAELHAVWSGCLIHVLTSEFPAGKIPLVLCPNNGEIHAGRPACFRTFPDISGPTFRPMSGLRRHHVVVFKPFSLAPSCIGREACSGWIRPPNMTGRRPQPDCENVRMSNSGSRDPRNARGHPIAAKIPREGPPGALTLP